MNTKLESFLSSFNLCLFNNYKHYDISTYHLSKAFEYYLNTGINTLRRWIQIEDFVSMVETSKSSGCVYVGHWRQFFDQDDIQFFYSVLNNSEFWEIEDFLEGRKITKDNCLSFLDQAEFLTYIENETISVNTLPEKFKNTRDEISKIRKAKTEIKSYDREKKKEEKRNSIGYVYLITDGRKFKIGKSKDFEVRLRQLKKANPELKPLVIAKVQGYDNVEELLLAKYHSKRIVGEWFSFNEKEVNAVIKYLKELHTEISD